MVTSSGQAVGLQLCARGSGRSTLTELGVGGVGEQRRCAVPAAGCRVQRWRAAVPGSGTHRGGLALLCLAGLLVGRQMLLCFPFLSKLNLQQERLSGVVKTMKG